MHALYAGEVVHERLRPARHRLRYRVFMGLFDLDALPAARGGAFGYNRAALISFFDRDHGDGSGRPLRPQIEAALQAAGIAFDGGRIGVLCMPRVLGYVFNPLSVFFCHARDGRLVATVHEVNNTFGERRVYALPAAPRPDGRVEQACAKSFRVSPFLTLDMGYRFTIAPPGEMTSVAIVASDAEGPVLTAWFKGVRRPFTSASIVREWLAHPALTLKVIAGIHWEALFIWLKLKRAAAIAAPGRSARASRA
jgi:DUF1365 family protein